MAAFDTTTLSPARDAGQITRVFHRLAAAFTSWNDARVTRKQLSNLTDRELDDIGLTYSDISAVCKDIRG